MPVNKKETISFYSHLFGVIISIPGLVMLILATRHHANFLSVAFVYGFSLVFLYAASSLYHGFKKKDEEISFWRKLDHLAIFVLIAGTYTPVCYLYLDGYLRWIVLAVQWGFVLFGLFFIMIYLNASRLLYTAIYVVMASVAILLMGKMWLAMSAEAVVYLFAGAVSYSVGAAMYALKRPVLKPGVFSFHEMFHVFILIGSFMHFMMIYRTFRYVIAG